MLPRICSTASQQEKQVQCLHTVTPFPQTTHEGQNNHKNTKMSLRNAFNVKDFATVHKVTVGAEET